MKKHLKKIMLLIVALLLSLTPATALEAVSTESANLVRKFTPVIDGVIDDEYLLSYHIDHEWPEERTPENYWAFGKFKFETLKDDTGHEVIIDGKPIYTGECGYDWDAQASSYFLWDDDRLYVAIEVTDTDYGCIDDEHYQIAVDYSDEHYFGPSQQDSVHLMFQVGDSIFSIVALRDGRAIYKYGTDTPYDLYTWEDYASGTVTGISNYGVVISDDGGYTIELSLPVKIEVKNETLYDGATFKYGIALYDSAEDSDYEIYMGDLLGYRDSCDLQDTFVLRSEVDLVESVPTLPLTLSGETAFVVPPYDLTADGVFDTKDLTRLMRVIAGDGATAAAQSADINGDDAVDVKDLTRIMKYLAGAEK